MFYPHFPFDAYAGMRADVSYVRILHASPDAPAVDIYTNGNPIARNLYYRSFTQYIPLAPGNYSIGVFPAGQMQNPLVTSSVNIPQKSIFTAAVMGQLNNIGLQLIPDWPMAIPPGKVMLRFVHLSPDTPAVDITLRDGTRIFRNVSYKGVTDYLAVNPGTYTFEARVAGTENIVLFVPNINLKSNRFYSIYAVGLAGGNPPLQFLIPLDGNSYINL